MSAWKELTSFETNVFVFHYGTEIRYGWQQYLYYKN